MPSTYAQAGLVRRLLRATGRSALLSSVYARTLHHVDKPVYRMTRGRTTATALLSGLPVVLLTTRGGRRRRDQARGRSRGGGRGARTALAGGFAVLPGLDRLYARWAAPRRMPVLVLTSAQEKRGVAPAMKATSAARPSGSPDMTAPRMSRAK